MIRLNRGLKEAKMRNLQRMVGLTMLCSLLLAGCEGSGGGGGSPGIAGMTGAVPPSSPGTMPPSSPGTVPPSSSDPSHMSYGAWNQQIRDIFPTIAACLAGCGELVPAAPANIVSPFGATAAFDPAQDQWAATWTGGIEGYRFSDPDAVGTGLDRRWTGEAKLKIESMEPSHVRFWVEEARYDLEAGGRSGVSPDLRLDTPGSPDGPYSPDTAWVATLSTAIGEKGYFSGNGVHGQFDAAPAGVTPTRAIGHFQRRGHTGVFEVSR